MRNGHNHEWFEQKREALHDLGVTVRGYGGTVTDQIKAHPLAAAGIAFAAGYLLTRIVRR